MIIGELNRKADWTEVLRRQFISQSLSAEFCKLESKTIYQMYSDWDGGWLPVTDNIHQPAFIYKHHLVTFELPWRNSSSHVHILTPPSPSPSSVLHHHRSVPLAGRETRGVRRGHRWNGPCQENRGIRNRFRKTKGTSRHHRLWRTLKNEIFNLCYDINDSCMITDVFYVVIKMCFEFLVRAPCWFYFLQGRFHRCRT